MARLETGIGVLLAVMALPVLGAECPFQPTTGCHVAHPEIHVNPLWLNYPHPWHPIVTAPGEQRRVVVDVDNLGWETARDVVMTIEIGGLLQVDHLEPAYAGQRLDCVERPDAVTCQLGDIGEGDTVYVKLFVTPLVELTWVPVSVSAAAPLTAPDELAAGLAVPDGLCGRVQALSTR